MDPHFLPNDADGTDVPGQLQIYVNSILAASFISQLVILIVFLQEASYLPRTLKFLSIGSLCCSAAAPLAAFLGNNVACEPAIQLGCHITYLDFIGKWSTIVMRIWALSKRNKIAVFCMGGLILLNSVLWEGNCFQMVGFRVLPRVCALRQAQPLGLDILAKIFIPIQMAFFVGLHLYYLCGVVLKDPAPTASQSHTQSQVAMGPMRKPSLTPTVRTLSPAAGRFKATLRMFMNDIVVMLIDVIRPPLTYVCQDPVFLFIVVYGIQIVHDMVYVAYMRQFTLEIRLSSAEAALPNITQNASALGFPKGPNGSMVPSGSVIKSGLDSRRVSAAVQMMRLETTIEEESEDERAETENA